MTVTGRLSHRRLVTRDRSRRDPGQVPRLVSTRSGVALVSEASATRTMLSRRSSGGCAFAGESARPAAV